MELRETHWIRESRIAAHRGDSRLTVPKIRLTGSEWPAALGGTRFAPIPHGLAGSCDKPAFYAFSSAESSKKAGAEPAKNRL